MGDRTAFCYSFSLFLGTFFQLPSGKKVYAFKYSGDRYNFWHKGRVLFLVYPMYQEAWWHYIWYYIQNHQLVFGGHVGIDNNMFIELINLCTWYPKCHSKFLGAKGGDSNFPCSGMISKIAVTDNIIHLVQEKWFYRETLTLAVPLES